jgi:hypothetical protein
MPNFCVLNDKLITPEDIYKFNIDKNSEFICYNCDNRLHFRQSRNGDKDYTEHFYHQNTVKDTHIDCEINTYEKIKKSISEFHNKFSNFIKLPNREFIRRNNNVKHIVDGYDFENNMGIEFQNSKITPEDIISRDNTSELDWIFNVESQYIRKIDIGKFIVCEIPQDNWEKAVKVVKDNVFLYTGKKEWIWLVDRECYRIEIEGRKRNVWIGEICSFQDVLNNTCLHNIITDEGKIYFNSNIDEIEVVKNIYARCKNSMFLLDDIHRNYVNNHNFINNNILAIKSVAGSGKTTTLLNLSKVHNDKKILYIAFNKSLIKEIKEKITKQKITNLFAYTFDALLYKLYVSIKGDAPEMNELRPQFIGKIIPFLEDKDFKMKEYYCNNFIKFLNDADNNDIRSFAIKKLGSKKPLLEGLWDKVLQNKFITFETIRKQAYINRWFKNYIDKHYDMVMIDETQDFDMIMLKMLLNDTTIPKIFVGDPKQSIYQFRGCINAFNYLPNETLVIEFYSTFRTGNPACDTIRTKFKDCWIISKSKNDTNFVESFEENEKYVYLFRSWRVLLETAEKTKNIWIYNFETKMNDIRKLHKKLSYYKDDTIDEEKFEDDLPKFLTSINSYQLEKLLDNIQNNSVSYNDAICKLYTVHSYKGMEDDNIRMANDIDIHNDGDTTTEENLYYVSITRGMKKIIIDEA